MIRFSPVPRTSISCSFSFPIDLQVFWQGKNSGKFECIGEDLVFKVLTTSSKTGEVVGEKRGFDVSLSSVKNAQVSWPVMTDLRP
jgi:hypothetical protein